jgi:hypothetical protein
MLVPGLNMLVGTLAYLETNRDAIAAQRSWWSLRKAALRSAQKPAVKEVPAREEKRHETPRVQNWTTKPKWLN